MYIIAIICVFILATTLTTQYLSYFTNWSLTAWSDVLILIILSGAITFLLVYYNVI